MTRETSSGVGKTATAEAVLAPGPADRLTAALDYGDPPFAAGDQLPHAWHWLYFLASPRASALGSDGRGAAGDIVPAFEGLNRMWAGGGFVFGRPLRIGEVAKRHSAIKGVEEKTGRSGRLVLVTLEHVITGGDGGRSVTERHDLVFRERKPQGALGDGERAGAKAGWRRELTPNEVLLFCFSALTYNSHRIHYDWRYVTEVEGYPGLLVHGPLTAILLLGAIARNLPGRELTTFDYRALRPMFCGNRLAICGTVAADGSSVDVWAEDHQGFVAMRGKGALR